MLGVHADSGSILLVVAADELHPRQSYILGAESTVADASALLTNMATNKRVIGLSQLSAMITPRLDLRSFHWSNSFNLVVGDTVPDRVLYWNARALISPWRDGSDVDLCVPRAKFDDPVFVESLREYLNHRNHVNGDSGSGSGRVTIRSVSLGADELIRLTEQLRHAKDWWGGIDANHEQIASVADCIPEAKKLEDTFLVVGRHGFRSPNLWAESFSIGNELRLNATEPEHLRHNPASLINPSSGAWAIDLDIERAVDHSPYSNVRHRWRLPRRLRVTSAFCRHYQISQSHGAFTAARVSAEGFLTLFTVATSAFPNVSLPSDQEAIVSALTRGRDWIPFNGFRDQSPIPQLCVSARRSNAGHYFWGVYQLFGNLKMACSVLLHEFWRKQLEAYGATDQRTSVRQEQMETILNRRFNAGTLNLANAEQLRKLADIVLQESDSLRLSNPWIDWANFEKDFKELTAREDAANPLVEDHDRDEGERYRSSHLRDSVQNLCGLGVLHQGYEHQCRKCLHRNWVSIADLRPDIVCEVCHDAQPAPVSKAWQFRLNGFLREALRRHGVGPLFWVLKRMQQHNHDSFWFEGPLDIYFDWGSAEAGRPETDIDLTIIDNGRVRMCEVKQSERQLKDPKSLAQTMAKLRPDIAMIAVMEADSPALQRKFKAFSSVLAGTGVTPELLTLDAENDIEHYSYFL